MSSRAHWRSALILIALALAGTDSSVASAQSNKTVVAETIKRDVARLVAGLNADDAVRTTAYDAPNVISMECGSPPTVGIEADRDGFSTGFKHDPQWHVHLIDETVGVASSGDLAVYRGIYNEDNGSAGVVTTHKTNFRAEFKRQSDGSMKIVWYSVSNMGSSSKLG